MFVDHVICLQKFLLRFKCSNIMLFNMYSFTCVRLGTETMIKGWCGLVRYLVSCELLWNEVTYRTARGDEAFRERKRTVFWGSSIITYQSITLSQKILIKQHKAKQRFGCWRCRRLWRPLNPEYDQLPFCLVTFSYDLTSCHSGFPWLMNACLDCNFLKIKEWKDAWINQELKTNRI